MKKFWKSLALLLCLLAGFGFVVTGCSDGDDGNGGDTAKIALSKEAVTLQPGGSVTLTLNKGSTPITSGVTWSVDDPTVANVNASDTCVATVSPKDGVSSGSTNLIATYESKKYTAKITVSDISLPITIEFSSSFVNDEFGALTPSQSKETYAGSGLNTWDTGTAEVRTTTGMYVLANASGLIKNPREGDKFITYYYGSGGSAAAAVGGTLPAAGLNSYLAFSAAQVKTDKASVKVTINAHGVDYDHAKDAAEAGKYGTIGIVDSSNNKVLAVSETLTAEAKDYVFYVKPSTRLVITNVGKDGTSISFNKMTLEASDNAVTADGNVYATSVSLASESLSDGKLSLISRNTETVTATLAPATTTETSVTWTSSDTAIATVAADPNNSLKGVITAVSAGTATITASSAKSKAEIVLTVTAANNPVASVTLDATSGTIDLSGAKTGTKTIKATIVGENPNVAADATKVTWTSNNTNVTFSSETTASGTDVTVTAALASSGTSYETTITASAGEKTATYTLTVTDSTLLINETIDWSVIDDTVSTATAYSKNSAITVYAQNNGFQGDKFNFYAVSAYAGDTVSSGIKSYFEIASSTLTNAEGNVKLVINAKKTQNSPILGVLKSADGLILAQATLTSEDSDYEFIVASATAVKLITMGGTGNLSWALNNIRAYKTSDSADTTAPSAPTIGEATSGTLSATVTWTDSDDTASAIVYYKTASDGDYTKGTVVAAGSQSASITNLTAGTEYTFAVSVRDAYGNESAKSATTTATPTASTGPVAGTTYTYAFDTSASSIGSFSDSTYTTNDTFVTVTPVSLNHGLNGGSNLTMTVQVAGNVTLTFTGCNYDAEGLTFTVMNGETTVQAATATNTKGKGNGSGTGETVTYSATYTGSATTLTVTWSGQAYIHQLVVAPVE